MVRRASSTLLAAFAVGALALLLAAAPAAARPPLNEFGCPPGCKTCRQMTEQEVAQLRAKWEAKMAEKQQRYAARNAAAGTSGAGGPPGGGHGGPDKQRNWLQRLSEGPVYACETCIAGGAYELKDTRCVCAAGYGWPKHDRAQGAPKTAPACEPCPAGTVSGPDAPKPDWAALKDKFFNGTAPPMMGEPHFGGPGGMRNGRNGTGPGFFGGPGGMMRGNGTGPFGGGPGRRGGPGFGAGGPGGHHPNGGGGCNGRNGRPHGLGQLCVPCPSGKSNDARTKCL